MTIKIRKDKAEEWRKIYEDGAALDDIAAIESYKEGRLVSVNTIRQTLVWAGAKIRSYSETIMLRQRQKYDR